MAIEWNEDMDAAPKDGFCVLVWWPGMKRRFGLSAQFLDGAWRPNRKCQPFEQTPTKWRYWPGADQGI